MTVPKTSMKAVPGNVFFDQFRTKRCKMARKLKMKNWSRTQTGRTDRCGACASLCSLSQHTPASRSLSCSFFFVSQLICRTIYWFICYKEDKPARSSGGRSGHLHLGQDGHAELGRSCCEDIFALTAFLDAVRDHLHFGLVRFMCEILFTPQVRWGGYLELLTERFNLELALQRWFVHRAHNLLQVVLQANLTIVQGETLPSRSKRDG